MRKLQGNEAEGEGSNLILRGKFRTCLGQKYQALSNKRENKQVKIINLNRDYNSYIKKLKRKFKETFKNLRPNVKGTNLVH